MAMKMSVIQENTGRLRSVVVNRGTQAQGPASKTSLP